MIPFNALTTETLDLPYLTPNLITTHVLPKANCVQLKASNEVSINRSILNLITIPQLRAAYLFHFKEDKTELTIYESKIHPLSDYEVKGAMVATIRAIKHNYASKLSTIKMDSHSFITNTKTIVNQLETFTYNDKVMIVLVFKEFISIAGNYYDETTFCRAMLSFKPQKPKSVIRKVTSSRVKNVIRTVEKQN